MFWGQYQNRQNVKRAFLLNLPIKDALMFATGIAYGREPNSRMLGVLMDREDGKPEPPKENPQMNLCYFPFLPI